jgi:hypothetical protein
MAVMWEGIEQEKRRNGGRQDAVMEPGTTHAWLFSAPLSSVSPFLLFDHAFLDVTFGVELAGKDPPRTTR